MITLTPDNSHHIRYDCSRLPPSTKPPTPDTNHTDSTAPSSRPSLNWIIFGATGHIGSHLTRTVLALGDKVAACAINALSPNIFIASEFADICLPFAVDVRSSTSVIEAVENVINSLGRIDIVVNCFGWGIAAACEDQDDEEVRGQLDTNLLGIFHTVRACLPHLRQNAKQQLKTQPRSQTSGKRSFFPTKIFNFSSVLGVQGIPGLGPYSASKNAVEGLTESLMYEIEDMGCKAVLVQMGHSSSETPECPNSPKPNSPEDNQNEDTWNNFKPEDDGLNNQGTNDKAMNFDSEEFRIKEPSNNYIDTPADVGSTILRNIFQPGFRGASINRACEIVWETAHCEVPPMRLILGTQALETMRDKLRSSVEEIEDWKYLYK
ncbi:NAD(P)-binding protein [Nadsonia fulvescens var. elongata DSM 6958]|uniref:NAD(P)-binding protein n=1 Tax=Nadsonia fulvescens var. elongata DSM 6958 TaxID=857566 RepID=A0A1E3PIG6_9ASCO|nr:NAD(P)-binding protein [Nadsonia fulvescens var. elongata DSM 6958]